MLRRGPGGYGEELGSPSRGPKLIWTGGAGPPSLMLVEGSDGPMAVILTFHCPIIMLDTPAPCSPAIIDSQWGGGGCLSDRTGLFFRKEYDCLLLWPH